MTRVRYFESDGKHCWCIGLLICASLAGCGNFNDDLREDADQAERTLPERRPTGLIFLPVDDYNSIPLGNVPLSGTTPSNIDLATDMPTPGDQGQQDSCVGWAVGYALKTYQERVERGWSLSTGSHLFSPAYLFNQIKVFENCSGGSYIADALNVLFDQGCSTWSDMPYDVSTCDTQPGTIEVAAASDYRIAYWRRVNHYSLGEIKAYLAAGMPVVLGMRVYENFYDLSGAGANAVYDTTEGDETGGHAVVAVGYSNSDSRFKIINSWGETWGDAGYFYITYDLWPQVIREGYVAEDQTVGPALAATAAATPGEILLGGNSVLTAGASGGTPPYSYAWSGSDGAEFTQQAVAVSPAETTTYTLTVTDSASPTQVVTDTVVVSVNVGTVSPLEVTAADDDATINQGETTALRGLASGGTPPYSYRWSAEGWAGSNGQDVMVNPTQTTTYRLVVTDGSSAERTAWATVTVTSDRQLPAIELAKFAASDAAEGSVGNSVSVSGDVAVIGASRDDEAGAKSGSAYVYRYNGSSWAREAKLTASDAAAGDMFGVSVSVSGDVAVIGAWFESDGAGAYSGSAYVYRYDGVSWAEETKLTASDATAMAHFGASVSVSGDLAVIGAYRDGEGGSWSGSAYVYRYDGSTWTEEAKLTASDAAEGDRFGLHVSVNSNVAVIGAHMDDDAGSDSGSVYIYRYNGSSWVEEAKLIASDAAAGKVFGSAVSVSDDVVVVGTRRNNDAGVNSGSAYVYRYDGGRWVEEAKLTASDAAAHDAFGSVSVSGDVVVVGAHSDDDAGNDSGSAYVYRYNGARWVEEGKITASDAAMHDHFGTSVSVSGDLAVIGAYSETDAQSNNGSAYVFHLRN